MRNLRFQSTCPRGARPKKAVSIADEKDFNPRAHGGHDGGRRTRASRSRISIHVPAGGTTSPTIIIFRSRYFNPRAREGHDPPREEVKMPEIISIHVPARGTTQTIQQGLPDLNISIHVPARGTTATKGLTVAIMTFQSTCPRGARL